MTKQITITKQLTRPGPGGVPASVAGELLRLVESHVKDPALFLRSAGVGHLDALLGTGEKYPGASVSLRDFTRLYAKATEVLDAQAALQEGRAPLTKLGLDMMCHSVITCQTLRNVIHRLDAFSSLLAPRTARLTLSEKDGAAQLEMATIRTVRNGCSYFSDLTGLSTYHRLFGWLVGEEIPLITAGLRYRAFLNTEALSYLISCPVEHHALENALHFPARYLDWPVVRDCHELEDLLKRFPFDLELSRSKDAPLGERISHIYSSLISSGEPLPTAEQLASRFSISVATLKRLLQAEGTSVSELKANARMQFAAHLLRNPRLSVLEISRRLQFSDAGAFCRAFKRLNDVSPSEWRKRQ